MTYRVPDALVLPLRIRTSLGDPAPGERAMNPHCPFSYEGVQIRCMACRLLSTSLDKVLNRRKTSGLLVGIGHGGVRYQYTHNS
jgi:hypothetical protein